MATVQISKDNSIAVNLIEFHIGLTVFIKLIILSVCTRASIEISIINKAIIFIISIE